MADENEKRRTTLVDATATVEEYINKEDWRINANANTGYSHAGLVNNLAGKLIANYWLDEVYSKEEGDAHRNGDYHIHDLDNLAPYCCGHDFQKLLDEGFNGVVGRPNSKPPKHFREALYQLANYFGILQAEWAGAQAVSSFDTYLSPYVFFDMEVNDISYADVKRAMRNFIYNLNVPSRWGQSPFTNITIDWTVPNFMKDMMPVRNGKNYFISMFDEWEKRGIDKDKITYIKDKVLLAIHERMEDIDYPLYQSVRADDEALILSFTYRFFQKEMNIINKAFYEILNEGDTLGQPFTFPIPTINITEDFDWNGPNTDLLFENTAKYGSSYFQNFIGSQYMIDENGNKVRDPNAYSPNDVRSMCCRLQLDKRALRRRGGGLFGSDSKTGSVQVVTINCPRLGYLYKGDKEGLYKRFDYLCDLAKSVCEKKRKVVTDLMERGLYPYTKRYIGSFDTYFSTIGVNGVNEMIRNFTNDEHDITDEFGQKFASDFLDRLRERLLMYQEETGNLYNGESSPAEGCFFENTTVWTDKGFKKIKDLVGKSDVHVFSFNEEIHECELKPVESIYMTSAKAPVMRMTFDNGRQITCTHLHPFAKRKFKNNTSQFEWVEACNLKVGDHLKSIYLKEKDTGHVIFGQNSKVHKIVAKAKYGEIPKGYVVHHINENKWDNSLENITIMTDSEHKRLHLQKKQELGQMKVGCGEKNPFYGKHHTLDYKMKSSDLRAFYTPEQREQMKDAYVNGHLSFAQIGRLLGLGRIQVKECIRMLQRNNIVVVDWPTCGSWQYEETPIEYLYKLGKDKSNIIRILKGSKKVREMTSEYVDYLNEANHIITNIEYLNEEIPVYNMTVKDNHNYYISDSEDAKDCILVHNCMRRFAHSDKKKYPDIIQAGFKDSLPYYTNSSQLPVEFTADPFTALDLQDNLQRKYTGGTVLHLYMRERVSSIEICKKLVKAVLTNYRLPYISVTPTFSVCPIHGRIEGEHEFCPKCDQELLAEHAKEINEGL